MYTYLTRSLLSRAVAVSCAMLDNALVLGGMLGLFNTVSSDAMLAKAKTNASPAPSAMAERSLPSKARS